MKQAMQKRSSLHGEQGYGLLLIMLFLAMVVLATMAIGPTIITDNQREKEQELIWRGKQYARGVKLYYRKTQRFPTSLEDLTKPKTGIRFMRQAYKDPMNSVDGSWRLIYVGPNGQLIGSLKNRPLGGGSQTASAFGSSGSTSAFGSQSIFGKTSAFGSSAPAGATQTSNTTNATNPTGSDSSGNPGTPVEELASSLSNSPTIIGGNIIGVGSKINKKSFKWYEKAKNYREFEFIWDPSKEILGGTIGGASQGIGTPIGNAPGTTPNSPFSSSVSPIPSPSQNPNPNQGQIPNSPPETPLQAPPNPN
jgi:hypothetical protein